MKKLLKKGLVIIGLPFLTSNAFATGIPVVDVAALTAEAKSQVEHMVAWAEQKADMVIQIANQVRQIQQLKEELESMTGSRALGLILNDPALKNYLPTEFKGVYDSIRDGGYSGISGTAKAIYDANKIFDSCAFITIEEQKKLCEARAVKASQDKGFALDAFDKAIERVEQIGGLMDEINNTVDPKGIAELQARIGAEQANIQNEQTKLQLFKMVAEAESRVQKQRKKEINAKDNARRGWTQPDDIEFN